MEKINIDQKDYYWPAYLELEDGVAYSYGEVADLAEAQGLVIAHQWDKRKLKDACRMLASRKLKGSPKKIGADDRGRSRYPAELWKIAGAKEHWVVEADQNGIPNVPLKPKPSVGPSKSTSVQYRRVAWVLGLLSTSCFMMYKLWPSPTTFEDPVPRPYGLKDLRCFEKQFETERRSTDEMVKYLSLL